MSSWGMASALDVRLTTFGAAAALGLGLGACKVRTAAEDQGSSILSVNDESGCVPEGVKEDRVTQGAQTNPSSALGNPNKAAVLVYYGVDSAEPFMAHTIDHEVRDLKAACEFRRRGQESKVNFLVFLNSYYVANPSGAQYLVCKDGKLSPYSLPPELSGWLEAKRALFTKADINWDQASGPLRSGKLRYLMRYPVDDEKIRGAYQKYPFAHPDFFALLFDHARQIFPPAQYAYYLHMKSHGSDQLLLTGLTGEIEKSKSDCQKTLWDKSMAGIAAGSGGGAVSTATTLPFERTTLAASGPRGPDDELHLTLMGLGDTTIARVPVCLLRIGPNKELFGETKVEGGARLADLEVGEKKFCDWRFGEMSAPAATGGTAQPTLGDVRLGDVRLGDVRLGDVRLGDVRLGDVRLGDARLGDVRLGDARLGDVRLGDVRLGDSRLGDARLGADGGRLGSFGLGTTGAGLGTFRLGNDGAHLGTTGLGAGNHFGMPSYALNGVLVDLIKNLKRTPDEAPTEVAFLMLESCDSKMVNKDPIARHLLTLVPELKAYYSAKGSLWYRNLDWDDILMDWQMSAEAPTAAALQKRLLSEVEHVVNYVRQ